MSRTLMEQRETIERILAAWREVPELRLGQFISCVLQRREDGDPFYVKDDELVTLCEEFVAVYK